jgi:hypothetical protein
MQGSHPGGGKRGSRETKSSETVCAAVPPGPADPTDPTFCTQISQRDNSDTIQAVEWCRSCGPCGHVRHNQSLKFSRLPQYAILGVTQKTRNIDHIPRQERAAAAAQPAYAYEFDFCVAPHELLLSNILFILLINLSCNQKHASVRVLQLFPNSALVVSPGLSVFYQLNLLTHPACK